MIAPIKQNPAGGRGSGKSASEQRFHVQHASAEPLLQRLEGVQKSGNGWRAKCPACGGQSRKLAIAESDGRVLIHCFAGCEPLAVLQAIGLSWSSLMPPRHWPQSRDERKAATKAIRECGWRSAVEVLATESIVAKLAAVQLISGEPLTFEDFDRLSIASERIDHAAAVLVEASRWKASA